MKLNYYSQRRLSLQDGSPIYGRDASLSSTHWDEVEKRESGFGESFIESMEKLRQTKEAQYLEALFHLQRLGSLVEIPELQSIIKKIQAGNANVPPEVQYQNRNPEVNQKEALNSFVKGKKQIESGRLEEGLQHLVRSVQNNPKENRFRFNLALLLTKLKMFQEALSHLSTILVSDSGMVECYRVKGDCLHALSRYEEAISIYRQGLTLSPGHQGCIGGIKKASVGLMNNSSKDPYSPKNIKLISQLQPKLSNPKTLTQAELRQISALLSEEALKFKR